jgi:ribosomal protein S18 acetylase RimI-like enzyme
MPAIVQRRRFSECSLEEAAAGFTEGFSGYVMPMNVTVRSLELRIERDHVDLDESLVFFDGEKPAGILMVNRRGNSTRIGALGIGPTIRGQGFGRNVMLEAIEKAGARGDTRMVLEVINSNTRARDLYLSLGFAVSRRLVGFSRSGRRAVPDAVPPLPCTLPEAARLAARFSNAGLSWQAAPLSFERAGPPLKGFSIDGKAVAILDDTGKNVRIFCLAVDPAHRREGLGRAMAEGLAAFYPGRKLFLAETIPEGLLDRFMRRIGWRKSSLTQSEMVLTIS